jgi:hypothetical protein
MKHRWVFAFLLGVVVLVFGLATLHCKQSGVAGADAAVTDGGANPSGPPPAIACEKAEFNFGTVGEGEDVVHTFVIKNNGQGPLKIVDAKGG